MAHPPVPEASIGKQHIWSHGAAAGAWTGDVVGFLVGLRTGGGVGATVVFDVGVSVGFGVGLATGEEVVQLPKVATSIVQMKRNSRTSIA